MRVLQIVSALSAVLAAIGAINWGLVGLFRFNLVSRLLGKSTPAERLVYLMVGIAGTWLAVALALPAALVALGVRGSRPPRGEKSAPIVGKTMHTIGGTALSGKEVTLPRDTRGKIAFVVMGFAYEARFDVEDWVRAFEGRFGRYPDVVLFEVPVIGGVYRLFAPMIDAGMRQATPAEAQDSVVTVYGSQGPIREALGAAPSSDTWVYLLDRDGTVLFQRGGHFDPHGFKELTGLVESAIARGRAEKEMAA